MSARSGTAAGTGAPSLPRSGGDRLSSSSVLILPAYNEGKSIGDVIRAVRSTGALMDIVVIDDGSADDTAQQARDLGVCVVSLPINLGYGAALQTGYKHAVSKGYEYLVQMDSDGQHDPRFIKPMLQAVQAGEADIVIGSRFLGQCGYRFSRVRWIGVLLFRGIIYAATGLRITDPTSGFQAMRRQVFSVCASAAYPVDYPDADVIILLCRLGLTVKEMPVTMYPSSRSSLHAGLKPVYYVFKMLLSILMIALSGPARHGDHEASL